MEIINKINENYKAERRIRNGKPFIVFAKDCKRIFISAAAAWEWDLVPNMKAHFAVDIDRVYIFFNDDHAGVTTNAFHGGLRIQSTVISQLLMEKVKEIRPQYRFMLRKSNTKIQDSLTLEIMIHKKIEQ
jgi:hypothetical protein